MFRGNPQLTGVARGNLPENPQPLWIFQADDIIESTAAIHDGLVYVASLTGTFYAVDFATGAEKWKFQAEDEIKSSPSVCKGRVYFGDSMGNFYALDAKTGKKV